MMAFEKFAAQDFLPLPDLTTYILIVLYGQELSGADILREARFAMHNDGLKDKTVTATFYRLIGKLVDDGLIEIIENPSPAKIKDQRVRKLYKLTPNGETVLHAQRAYSNKRQTRFDGLNEEVGLSNLMSALKKSVFGGV